MVVLRAVWKPSSGHHWTRHVLLSRYSPKDFFYDFQDVRSGKSPFRRASRLLGELHAQGEDLPYPRASDGASCGPLELLRGHSRNPGGMFLIV